MRDTTSLLRLAEDAIRAAGALIIARAAQQSDFRTKSDRADRDTPTDHAAHTLILEALRKGTPDIPIFSEESANSEAAHASTRWILDPLDGTMNFTQGIPFCGTSLAYEEGGEIMLGVLHFPLLGWTCTALRGGGTKRNGEPVHVSQCPSLANAVVSELFSDREARGKTVLYPPVTAYRRFGSAITSLALVADGRVDGTAIRCRTWDMAAGKILIEEAGGTVTVIKDSPKDPLSPLTCIASCPGIHGELVEFVGRIR